MKSCFIILLCFFVAANLVQSFKNEKITRTINAGHFSSVKSTLVVKVLSPTTPPASIYQVFLPTEEFGGRLARYTCSIDNNVVVDTKLEIHAEKLILLVSVPQSTSSSFTLTCITLRTAAVSPLPKEITQNERQRFVYHAEYSRVLSPYPLLGEESTQISFLAGSKVDLLSNSAPGVISTSNGRVVCGPYHHSVNPDDPLFPLKIQFDASQPYPVFTSVLREIELSHWGNVAFEEYFDVRNQGATLKGGFSRLDHVKRTGGVSSSFQTLRAHLPGSAFGTYYRDALGNITTSHLSKRQRSQVLDLQLRFPVYGGWHIEWYQGFNVPLNTLVSKLSDNEYVLDCDLFHTISVMAEKLTLHVVLPAGASEIHIESPTVGATVSEFRRFTYLDVPWTERKVLKIELADVFGGDVNEVGTVPRVPGLDRLRIRYKYAPYQYLEKPLAVSAGIFTFLLSWMVVGRGVSK